ncbi:MAG: response regulator transcription factor [Eubacterium sp.]|nr:response regulator transcription factor [Eubacterium sp.]
MTEVLIVDDQRMAQEHMEHALEAKEAYHVLAKLLNVNAALTYCLKHHVDLILMDVYTHSQKDGIDASYEIKQKFPKIKIIVVTSMMEVSYIERAKQAGVDSFWYKDISEQSLLEIIERTMAGEHIYPDKRPDVKIGQANLSELTKMELNVLRLICDGLEYDEMAEKLGISKGTVKFHVSNILSKTGYKNKTRLAVAATNQTVIVPSIPEDADK